MSDYHHHGQGHLLNVRGGVHGGLHFHEAPPEPPPDREPGGGGAAAVIGTVVVIILLVVGAVAFGAYSLLAGTGKGNASGPSPSASHTRSAPPASTAPAAKTYPVRITYDRWFRFIPQSVTIRPGDSLKFSNETGRSCKLTADDGYLPEGQGRNPLPGGGSYVVRFTEDGMQSVGCEEEPVSGVTVIVTA